MEFVASFAPCATSGFVAAAAIAAVPSSEVRKNSRRAGADGRFPSGFSVTFSFDRFEPLSPSFSGSRFIGLSVWQRPEKSRLCRRNSKPSQGQSQDFAGVTSKEGFRIRTRFAVLGRVSVSSNQIPRRRPQNRLSDSLRFHLLLQETRSFFFQADIQ